MLGSSHNPLQLGLLDVDQEGVGRETVLNASNERLDTTNEELHRLGSALHHITSTLLLPFL